MVVTGQEIDPGIIFNCGQAFRFRENDGRFCGVANGKYLEVWKTNEGMCAAPVCREDRWMWEKYFDLHLDYQKVLREFEGDEILEKSFEEGKGMRLLNQDPFETVISFIISANNNVKRIQKIIEEICSGYGTKIGERLYAFPTPAQLAAATEEQLREIGCGYRAPYIRETATRVAKGETDLNAIKEMEYSKAKEALIRLPGVGPKVADCILLFSMEKKDAFPKDVWMKRVLKILYHIEVKNEKEMTRFVRERFGPYAGVAQQYLFYYARKNKMIG